MFYPSEKMTRTIAKETQQLETDLNEERSRYQNLLSEHLRLEEKYDDLKEEMALSSVSNTFAHVLQTMSRVLHLCLNVKLPEKVRTAEILTLHRLCGRQMLGSVQCLTALLICKCSRVSASQYLFKLKGLFPLLSAERLEAWPQENRFYPQQQRIRVHVQLRVRRVGRWYPWPRSKKINIKQSQVKKCDLKMEFQPLGKQIIKVKVKNNPNWNTS